MSRIIKETTVYGGPLVYGYATMATLRQNQSVTAIFKELDFLFVEYDGVNMTKRRGYVLASDVQLQESVRTYTALASNKAIRVVATSAIVSEGPAFSGYMTLGSFAKNAFISFLGVKENDFALVEMETYAGAVRGYFYASYLRTLSNRVGNIISDVNSIGYQSPLNKFTAGQCTWYCWGRAYEKCGAKYSYCRYKKLPLISNVNQLNKLIYSTVKNKTAHIEFTTTYNADLKEAISRTGQQLSYSYKNIDRVNYTLYSVTFIY